MATADLSNGVSVRYHTQLHAARHVRVSSIVRALCILLLIGTAHAEPGFSWQAPAPCPDGDDVRTRIERRLNSPLEIGDVEVAITHDDGVFVAHVDTRGVTVANQIRTLRSARCDELADAVAVVVARLAAERRIPRVAAVETEPMPAVAITATVPERERRYGFGVHAMALSGIGTVPRVGVGAELSIFARRKQLFAELGFARWASESAYLVEGAPGRVDVGLDVITARFGWSPPRMPLRAWIGSELGAMHGQGEALSDTQGGSARWLAVTGGFGVGWPMTRYARLLGTFEIAVPTSRVSFTLAQGSDIYTSSAAAARCAIGFELGIP
jgi:hypothetical protein